MPGAVSEDQVVNLMIEGRRVRNNKQTRRFNAQEYYREWYARNKERRRAQMREYQRKRRAKGSVDQNK